jgi:hypothetical protein
MKLTKLQKRLVWDKVVANQKKVKTKKLKGGQDEKILDSSRH